jgi:DNA-binding PadR family transcriptional regulator
MERQLLLLGLLRAQKMHGYQLNEFLERSYDFVTDLKPSTAYYLLDKLATEGYVQVQVEQVGNRPPRRVYELTPAGEARFLELLRANLAGRTAPIYADEIGLSFMNELPKVEVRNSLAEKRQLLRADLNRLTGIEVTLRSGGSAQVYLAADHHLTLLRAELTWLDNLLERLNKDI